MNRLRSAKLVHGNRGPGGGYGLRIPAHEVNVERIVSVFEDVEAQRVCVLGHAVCNSTVGCPVHDMWSDVLTAYDRFLNDMTLERLAAIQRVTGSPKLPRASSRKAGGRKRSGRKKPARA